MVKQKRFFQLTDNYGSQHILVPVSLTNLTEFTHESTDLVMFLMKDMRKLEKGSRKTGG
jgi:hypothetical protein